MEPDPGRFQRKGGGQLGIGVEQPQPTAVFDTALTARAAEPTVEARRAM
jgi:hypothetical protein